MENLALLSTAVGVGFVHTLLGPDHYIPFVAMARAGKWSQRSTALVTCLCGIGHVASSVFISLIGILLGFGLSQLDVVQSVQGRIAAWLLIGCGLAYFVWGMRKARRDHHHGQGDWREPSPRLTPWILFTIFIFGPCEALIPLLMVAAAKGGAPLTCLVIAVFAVATIATMVAIVSLALRGSTTVRLPGADRFGHAIAGLMLVICGASIEWLGL